MDFKQITHFLALHQHKNFTQAAAACNISQPAFSQSIRKLEEELGGPLVNRMRRDAGLTPLGLEVIKDFESIQALEAKLKNAARRTLHGAPERLLVHIESESCLPVAIEGVRQFLARHPNVAIEITRSREAGEDAARSRVSFSHSRDRGAEASLSRELPPQPFQIICPADHPFAAETEVEPERFFAEDLIRWACCPMVEKISDLAERLEATLRLRFTVDDFFLARRLVGDGFGVSLAPVALAAAPGVATARLAASELSSPTVAIAEFSRRADGSERALVESFMQTLPGAPDATPQGAPRQTSPKAAQEAAQETSQEASQETSQEASENTSENAPEQKDPAP